MYHGLAPEGKARDTGHLLHDRPEPSHFEAHLKALTNSARVLTVEDAINEISEKGQLSCDTACITFDDGYSSVYEYAYPLLRKHDLAATVYLTTDWINRRMELWWEILSDLIAGSSISPEHGPEIEAIIGLPHGTLDRENLNSAQSKRVLHNMISSEFVSLEHDIRLEMMRRLATLFGSKIGTSPNASPLTWDQVHEMSQNGIRFGSHTQSHFNFRMTSQDTIEQELADSVEEMKRHINSDITGFAYPYGHDIEAYSQATELISRAGFEYACTAVQGINNCKSNKHLLYRETLPPVRSSALIEREISLDFIQKSTN